MVDNHQSIIIESLKETYNSLTHYKSCCGTTKKTQHHFDTFDGHVMVNYIEPNFQDIMFTLSTVSLITQKQFWDHLKF